MAYRSRASRAEEVAEELRLRELLDRPYGNLSAGQRTRVSLGKALLNRPEVLLLDEPTASLDPDAGDRMRTLLENYQRRSGCTMLLASHNMGEVERMCDEVIMLRAGRIVDQGSPAALLERYGRGNMDEVFLDIARERADASHRVTRERTRRRKPVVAMIATAASDSCNRILRLWSATPTSFSNRGRDSFRWPITRR